MSTLPLRYTGPRPFTESESDRFFGRDEDIDALVRTVRLNRMTVLTGKSGMGKSSLLQAGVVPVLEKEGYMALPARFEAWEAGKISPLNRLMEQLAALPESRNAVLEKVNAAPVSLWQQCKALSSQRPLLLVFDQFEELFTYPDAEVAVFGEALARAILNALPPDFEKRLTALQQQQALSDAETAFIEREMPLRVVFSIRSDRMDRLTRLVDVLPSILRNCYDLAPLSEFGARAAIIKTARAEGAFASPAFRFSPDALAHILQELTRPDERGRAREIQSFLLQIICQYAEERVVIGKEALVVETADLGDISEIIGAFYEYQISKISPQNDQQARAREFVEDGLIFDGVRMTLNEEYALGKFALQPATLAALENTHLIRAEAADGGRRNYELSHDALLEPINRLREARLAEATRRQLEAETEAARQKAEAEAQRARELEALKDKAEAEKVKAEAASRSAKQRSRIAAGVAVLALLAAAWAWYAQTQAKQATAAAEKAKREAIANECKANTAYLGFLKSQLETQERGLIAYREVGDAAKRLTEITERAIDSLGREIGATEAAIDRAGCR